MRNVFHWGPSTLALGLLAVLSARAEHRTIDFRKGIDNVAGVNRFGPNADAVMTADAQGLRITLPAGRQDTNEVGLELPLRLRGDFDISLGYELLAIGEPIPDPGCGVQMRLLFDAPSSLTVALTRLRKPPGLPQARLFEHVWGKGDTFGAARITWDADRKENLDVINVRAREPRGRLRLVRTGSQVQYLAREEGMEDYHTIRSMEIGTADVQQIRLFCFGGWRPVLADIRLVDLAIDAEQSPVAAVVAESPPPRKRAFLAPALLVAGVLVLAGVLVVYLAQKRKEDLSP